MYLHGVHGPDVRSFAFRRRPAHLSPHSQITRRHLQKTRRHPHPYPFPYR